MNNQHQHNLPTLLLSFGCGYVLLLVVLLGAGIPFLGLPLAMLFETPVSGYYVLVIREELQLLLLGDGEWVRVPQWNIKVLPQLMWLGICMNAIMVTYGAMALTPLALLTALVSALHVSLRSCLFLLPAIVMLVVPGVWCFALMLPLAVARFAWSGDVSQAFHFRTIWSLAAQRCRFALLSAAVFVTAAALNLLFTVLLPALMPVSEPSIEFVGMVIWAKVVARSFEGKLVKDKQNYCALPPAPDNDGEVLP